MSTLADSYVGRYVEEQASSFYATPRVPRQFAHLPAAVLDIAAELSAGDWRRCVVDENDRRSIIVYNVPMWQRS